MGFNEQRYPNAKILLRDASLRPSIRSIPPPPRGRNPTGLDSPLSPFPGRNRLPASRRPSPSLLPTPMATQTLHTNPP
ncbi:MAG TPA: hypothetical protein VNW04_02560, partial [Puia sp.]|nr:hypothetical protein [Puia sp.]